MRNVQTCFLYLSSSKSLSGIPFGFFLFSSPPHGDFYVRIMMFVLITLSSKPRQSQKLLSNVGSSSSSCLLRLLHHIKGQLLFSHRHLPSFSCTECDATTRTVYMLLDGISCFLCVFSLFLKRSFMVP